MMSLITWIMSCRAMSMSRPCATWHRTVVSPGTVAALPHSVVGSLGTVATHCEWLTGGHCTVAALQPRYPRVLQAHDDGLPW
jgi:hypothetical protein